MQIVERAFIYYTFVIYSLTALIFATVIVSSLYKGNNIITIELAKTVIVIFIFANFSAINLNVDGGEFTDSLILIFMAISLFYFSNSEPFKAFLITSLLINLSALLDPDYLTYFGIVLILGGFISGLLNRDLIERFGFALLSFFSSIISVFYLLLQAYFSSLINAPMSNALTFRSFNYVLWGSRNINLFYSFLLLGHAWSIITFAPPNALYYADHISTVKGIMYPTQVLLPPGFLTYVWLFTIIMIPILSFFSLFFKKYLKTVIPASIIALIFLLMANVVYIKPLYLLETYIVKTPIFGNAIGTTLALPGHALNALASMYYIMFSVTATALLGKFDSAVSKNLEFSKESQNFVNGISKNLKAKFYKYSIFAFLIFIITFSGWQSFNGTFWPMRAPAVPYGNQVANIGAYSPVPIDKDVLKAYNIISNSSSQNYGVVWIGGPIYSERVFGIPGFANVPYLPYLVENNMKSDVYYYLLYGNVKYVVISNANIEKNITGIYEPTFQDYGFQNFTQAEEFFSSIPGIKEVYNSSDVCVFEVENYSPILAANLLLSINQTSPYVSVLPSLFRSLGYKVAVVNNGSQITFGSLNSSISIISPVQAFRYIKVKGNVYEPGNYTTEGISGSTSIWLPDGFTIGLWGGHDDYYQYSNHTFVLKVSNGSTAESISYNGTFTGGPGGFRDPSRYVNLTVIFYAKSSENSSGFVNFLGEPNLNLQTYNVWVDFPFNMSGQYKKYVFYYIFPPSDAYVDFRIFESALTYVYIKNLTVIYTIEPKVIEDPSAPFGNYIYLNNLSILENGYKILVLADENNTFKWIIFTNNATINGNVKLAAIIFIKNNVSLKTGNYIIYSYPPLRYVALSYNDKIIKPLPGAYEDSVFILQNSNKINLTAIKPIILYYKTMLIYYVGILIYLAVLFVIFFNVKHYRLCEN